MGENDIEMLKVGNNGKIEDGSEVRVGDPQMAQIPQMECGLRSLRESALSAEHSHLGGQIDPRGSGPALAKVGQKASIFLATPVWGKSRGHRIGEHRFSRGFFKPDSTCGCR